MNEQTTCQRGPRLMELSRRRWHLTDDMVVVAESGDLICRLDTGNGSAQEVGSLLSNAPELLEALALAMRALEKAAFHLPASSEADNAAARAVGRGHQALRRVLSSRDKESRCGGADASS